LIEGQTGAGKEVMARRIHDASRRAGEFVAVNCGALPKHLLEAELFGHSRGAFSGAEKSRKGLFQSADGGTIVLDEIGEMDIEVQPTLLRVLQNRAVRAVGSDREVAIDCRVVAATNRDLESEVEAGRFRADLYARLAQVRVNVRPLRERHWEILSLFSQFAELSSASQLQSTVAEALLVWSWPYNVRELESLARTYRVVCGNEPMSLPFLKSHAENLYSHYRGALKGEAPLKPEDSITASVPLEQLRGLLEVHGGNVSAVAKALGKQRNQVYRWMKSRGLKPSNFRIPG
jgi:DNA-binding NtrC family response regulator